MSASNTPAPAKTTTCPRCFKTAPDDRANCINRVHGMCPKAITVPETRVVEVVCAAPCGGDCGKHLAVPIGAVMKRKYLNELGTCQFDVCRARVVLPAKAAETASPPPISDKAESDAAGGK